MPIIHLSLFPNRVQLFCNKNKKSGQYSGESVQISRQNSNPTADDPKIWKGIVQCVLTQNLMF